MKVESTEFADGLNKGCERLEIKTDFKWEKKKKTLAFNFKKKKKKKKNDFKAFGFKYVFFTKRRE